MVYYCLISQPGGLGTRLGILWSTLGEINRLPPLAICSASLLSSILASFSPSVDHNIPSLVPSPPGWDETIIYHTVANSWVYSSRVRLDNCCKGFKFNFHATARFSLSFSARYSWWPHSLLFTQEGEEEVQGSTTFQPSQGPNSAIVRKYKCLWDIMWLSRLLLFCYKTHTY